MENGAAAKGQLPLCEKLFLKKIKNIYKSPVLREKKIGGEKKKSFGFFVMGRTARKILRQEIEKRKNQVVTPENISFPSSPPQAPRMALKRGKGPAQSLSEIFKDQDCEIKEVEFLYPPKKSVASRFPHQKITLLHSQSSFRPIDDEEDENEEWEKVMMFEVPQEVEEKKPATSWFSSFLGHFQPVAEIVPVKSATPEPLCVKCGHASHLEDQCLTFKTKLCWYKDIGCKSKDCIFAHSQEEIETSQKRIAKISQ
jgi:hypothetical protein